MMEQVSEHLGMNYSQIPDSRYVAQPVNDSLFPWEEEMASTENPITIDEDEGFSVTMTPQNNPTPQPPAMKTRPALRTIETSELFGCSTAF